MSRGDIEKPKSPSVEKVTVLVILSLPTLLLMRKKQLATFYKSPMPYSENSNVPAWRIFSISCFHVTSDLYFAQISCNRCNKDRIRICETIQWHCCLHIDSVPGIMSPRDKKFLILIWWLAMFLQWCQLLFLMDNSYCWIFFCHHLEIHLFTKFLGRRKVLLVANWEDQRVSREEWASDRDRDLSIFPLMWLEINIKNITKVLRT